MKYLLKNKFTQDEEKASLPGVYDKIGEKMVFTSQKTYFH